MAKFIYCYLCDEPILRSKDLTKEHYCPKSRVPRYIAQSPYNIKPAIKIVNNIKGNLMPCEWEEQKVFLIYRALQCYHLDRFERQLLTRVLDKYQSEGPQYVCNQCAMKKFDQCKGKER